MGNHTAGQNIVDYAELMIGSESSLTKIRALEVLDAAVAKAKARAALKHRPAAIDAEAVLRQTGLTGHQAVHLLSALGLQALADQFVGVVEHRPAAGEGERVFTRVREQIEECSHDDSGRWQTCSGCHESEDGYDVGHYPFNKDFNCKLGGGCHECGGIGALWDTTNYDDYARFALSVLPEAQGGEEGSPICDIAAEIRTFAMNMRRDDSDAKGDDLRFYYEAIEGFVDQIDAALSTSQPSASVSEEVSAGLEFCRDCNGGGVFETGEMEKGVGGWGFQTIECSTCNGTGSWQPDAHDLVSRAGVLKIMDGYIADMGGSGGPDPYTAFIQAREDLEEMDQAPPLTSDTVAQPALVDAETGERLARRFHEVYERLAPSFGYETRAETRQFDPTTPNGRLMIAVCASLTSDAVARASQGSGVELPEAPSDMVIRAVDKAAHEHWPNARKMAVGMYKVIRDAALASASQPAPDAEEPK